MRLLPDPMLRVVSRLLDRQNRLEEQLQLGPLCPAAEGESLDMAAVTKRFILRSSAPAEGDAVSGLVQFAVR